MWQDALRVCKEYMPNKLDELQEEYEQMASADANRCYTLYSFAFTSLLVAFTLSVYKVNPMQTLHSLSFAKPLNVCLYALARWKSSESSFRTKN